MKILDFGLAKIAPALERTAGTSTLLQTDPGTIMGTVDYMSPEQVRGDAARHALATSSPSASCCTRCSPAAQPFQQRSPVGDDERDPARRAAPSCVHGRPRPAAGRCAVVAALPGEGPDARFASARDLAFSLESARESVRGSRRRRADEARPDRRRAPSSKRRAGDPRRRSLTASSASPARSRFARSLREPSRRACGRSRTPGSDSLARRVARRTMIAFVSSRDGARRIWLKQLADGTEVALTEGPDDSTPRFAPDGSSLLFTRTAPDGLRDLPRRRRRRPAAQARSTTRSTATSRRTASGRVHPQSRRRAALLDALHRVADGRRRAGARRVDDRGLSVSRAGRRTGRGSP